MAPFPASATLGGTVQSSLNYYHKGMSKYLIYLWQHALFIANDDYQGHAFLNLKSGDKDILPTYINSSGWLPHMGSDTKLLYVRA
ncbi:hypothetical protein P691DRAFT_768531 [Macrolepiota fuliginosa MF-IS2]|uniref:Uncharacterized protein n=1 Tax=Macrolepiota fuliginosa MF-IS2 TaxID=1400762 RepID=A0A9P5WYA7_9AGAR|nr:hypothetical protein P691DRAFT_768531 [Macrolepiota fuliginosa MF-IS2]